MQRILRDLARKYAFDWRDEPLLRVQPNEPFELDPYKSELGFRFCVGSHFGNMMEALRRFIR